MVEILKDGINALTRPWLFISLAAVLYLASLNFKAFWKPRVALALGAFASLFLLVSMRDPNFALIVKKADNVPIVAMLFLVGFFVWLSMYQAWQNDDRIAAGQAPVESADGENEKTWVWPDLVYTELLCIILGTIVLVVLE